MKKIRTIHFGVGYVGAEIARLAASRPNIEIVACIDADPAKAGRDLAEIIGAAAPTGVVISGDAGAVLSNTEADVVVHCTGSYLPQMFPQLSQIVQADFNIVSTCEELSYPGLQHADLADRLDDLARAYGVTVLGTGVNPGFAMDKLPLTLTGVCQEVRSMRVTRVVDASRRRLPLQRKVGPGLSVEAFQERVKDGTVRHVGLLESSALIAEGLGWELDELGETTEPVVADRAVSSEHFAVQPGQVRGVHQVVRGLKGGRIVLVLELQMALGEEDPCDAVVIEGTPPIDMVIRGGIHGDRATAAVIVNSIPLVAAAGPGLVTVNDLPMARSLGVA